MSQPQFKRSQFNRDAKKIIFRLLKFAAIGVGTGWFILTAFFILDVAGIRTMAHNNHLEYIVYPLLYFFFALTFGSVSMAIGVMTINKDNDDDDHRGGGHKSPIIDFSSPIKVRVMANN